MQRNLYAHDVTKLAQTTKSIKNTEFQLEWLALNHNKIEPQNFRAQLLKYDNDCVFSNDNYRRNALNQVEKQYFKTRKRSLPVHVPAFLGGVDSEFLLPKIAENKV